MAHDTSKAWDEITTSDNTDGKMLSTMFGSYTHILWSHEECRHPDARFGAAFFRGEIQWGNAVSLSTCTLCITPDTATLPSNTRHLVFVCEQGPFSRSETRRLYTAVPLRLSMYGLYQSRSLILLPLGSTSAGFFTLHIGTLFWCQMLTYHVINSRPSPLDLWGVQTANITTPSQIIILNQQRGTVPDHIQRRRKSNYFMRLLLYNI